MPDIVERRPDDNDPFNAGWNACHEAMSDEIERLRLQWTGMKDEVRLCHAEIERLRAENKRMRGDLDRVLALVPQETDVTSIG